MSWINEATVTTAEQNAAEMLKTSEETIRQKYASMLVSITSPYGQNERETWKTQEEEAVQFSEDPNAPCVMIRGMAASRGISTELMAAKILANSALFRQVSGQILGMQQAELDLLYPDKVLEV